jgi:putative NADH-flavin reductase
MALDPVAVQNHRLGMHGMEPSMTRILIATVVIAVILLLTVALLANPQKGRGFPPANTLPAPVLAAQPPTPLKILVIGGTSGIGRETAQLALERGHTVTVFARHPPAKPQPHERLRYLQGDVTDPNAVNAAVAGEDVIVLTISAAPSRGPVSVFSSGTRNVLDAMRAANIMRLIAVTGIGAGDSRGHGGFFYDHVVMPLLLQQVYQDKDRQEALIRGTTANWTIVRPGFLTNAGAAGRYQVVRNLAGVRSGSVARADVARFIIASAESSLFLRDTVLLSD